MLWFSSTHRVCPFLARPAIGYIPPVPVKGHQDQHAALTSPLVLVALQVSEGLPR